MTRRTRTWPRLFAAGTLPLGTALLTATVFVVDTMTNYEIAVATFYVVVVLLASRFCRPWALAGVAAGCAALMTTSFLLSSDGNLRTGVINATISLLAIIAAVWLAIREYLARAQAEQAEAQLARVVRATTLGEMGAAIAHEVNQPLAAMVANAHACRRWIAANPADLERIAQTVEAIADDAARASDIIARVRRMATSTPPQRAPTDINAVIRHAAAIAAPHARAHGLGLRLDLAADLPLLDGDAVQLQQVVMNLLVNATEACTPGGTIRITSAADGADRIAVTVEDDGPGIAPGEAARIFEPFHSTKPGGMGIGLAICRSIVEAHGGQIAVLPRAANGAAIGFTLPSDAGLGA